MFSKLRNAFVGLLVIAASTVAVTVSNSPVSATGTVAPSAVTSSPSLGAQSVPTWTNTNVIAVSAGLDHTCAIQASGPTVSSGSLFCWGKARSIGDGSTENSNIPVLVSSSNGFTNTAVTAVGAGGDTTCAIEGGTLWCWGGAGLGNLGNGTAGTSNVPVKVSASGTGAEEFFNNGNVTAVTAEYARTCAIESGKVFCWGSANDALGLGSANAVANVPNRVADSASAGFRAATATSIHMGTNFACSVAGGQIYCWGYGFSGQLGNGTNGDSNRPVLVSNSSGSEFTNAAVTSAFLGQDHACAVKAGRVSCWGKGTSNQLGDGVGTNRNIPAAVAQGGGFTNASAVTSGAAGDKHSCAIEAGILYCWGLNGNEGRLGDGGGADSSVPVKVSASLVAGFTNTGVGTGAVTAVTANSSGGNTGHACAIENKVVYCWGSFGMYGKLGIGATTGQGVSRPVKVFVLSAPAAATIDSVSSSNGSLNVSIRQPSDGGSIITGYDYTTDNGNTFTNVARPSGSNGNFFSITIPNLSNGTQYSVKVRAVNAIGAGAWSSALSGTPSGGNSGGVPVPSSCSGGGGLIPSTRAAGGSVGLPMAIAAPMTFGFLTSPTFILTNGSFFPAGLTVNQQTGAITGTPTASASGLTSSITVSGGAASCAYTVTFTITGSSSGGSSAPATPQAPSSGSTPDSSSTGSSENAASSTPAPTLVTSTNAATLVRTPGSESIIVNGVEVSIETNVVDIPAARTPASQRTPAQVASIQRAGAALLQQFLASLPAGATTNVTVVNTATGAVMQNLVFDASGNSVNVPVEDIVFLDGPQLSLMIGSNNANITADGKYQVGAGGIVGVTGSGLGVSANGEIIAMSTPTLLANFQTTAAGDFNKSATLPESIGVGDHTLVVATGSTYAMMGIRVVPAALPTTGSSSDRVVIIALFTLVFGALFFRGRRINLI